MEKEKALWPALLVKRIVDGAMFLANVCLALMLVLVFLNVLLRYAFRQPIYWGDEIMIYLMILMAFLGFGHNLMSERHIKMTALIERLSVRSQKVVEVFTSLLGIGYFGFLLAAGLYVMVDSFRMGYFSMVTGLRVAPWQLAMCVGLAVLLMASILYAINRISIAFGVREKRTDTG